MHPRAVISPGVVNIGPRGRARRRRLGAVALLAAVVFVALLASRHAPRLWALAAAPLFWAGWLGLLQAREKT